MIRDVTTEISIFRLFALALFRGSWRFEGFPPRRRSKRHNKQIFERNLIKKIERREEKKNVFRRLSSSANCCRKNFFLRLLVDELRRCLSWWRLPFLPLFLLAFIFGTTEGDRASEGGFLGSARARRGERDGTHSKINFIRRMTSAKEISIIFDLEILVMFSLWEISFKAFSRWAFRWDFNYLNFCCLSELFWSQTWNSLTFLPQLSQPSLWRCWIIHNSELSPLPHRHKTITPRAHRKHLFSARDPTDNWLRMRMKMFWTKKFPRRREEISWELCRCVGGRCHNDKAFRGRESSPAPTHRLLALEFFFLLNDFIILNENVFRFSYWRKAFDDVSRLAYIG